uniref:Uncharacterized protein n=1 Tax=Haptolina ericina TaxID=156174 RepID=A0A7S3FI33_9EUKA
MAKSIRSKVKKRLRTVKRGVVKEQLLDSTSKIGKRTTQIAAKLAEAATGFLQPDKRPRNAFRSDDPDAVIPQHDFRQGPDFRAGFVENSGYALVGACRPKLGRYGGDAPSARPVRKEGDVEPAPMAIAGGISGGDDGGKRRLVIGTEQIVPLFSSSKVKRKLKKKAQVDNTAAFRWT